MLELNKVRLARRHCVALARSFVGCVEDTTITQGTVASGQTKLTSEVDLRLEAKFHDDVFDCAE